MRVAGRRRRTGSLTTALEVIAEFLNVVGPDTTEEEWARVCPELERKAGQMTIATEIETGLHRDVLWLGLAEAKELRGWLNNDLCFARGIGLDKNPFQALVYRLNECKFEMGWQCDSVAKGEQPFHSRQAVVAIRKNKQILGRWATVSWPITKTLKDWCYAMLGKALETGDILRLKTCRQCAKYFVVVKDAKLAFCTKACKRTYHEEDRANTGYYRDRRRKQRKKDIADALTIVKQAREQRQSYRAVHQKIRQVHPNLPVREIERLLKDY